MCSQSRTLNLPLNPTGRFFQFNRLTNIIPLYSPVTSNVRRNRAHCVLLLKSETSLMPYVETYSASRRGRPPNPRRKIPNEPMVDSQPEETTAASPPESKPM